MTELTVRGADGQLGARLYVPRSAPTPAAACWCSSTAAAGWSATWTATTRYCRDLADEAGIRVLSVDYRLAPEAEAPAAAEDAIAAFTWAVEHAEDLGVDPALVGVGGDSCRRQPRRDRRPAMRTPQPPARRPSRS